MPEPLIFPVILVMCPLLLLGWLARRKPAARWEALLLFAFACMFTGFLLQWGQYPYAGSFYVRYVVFALLAITAWFVFKASRSRPWWVRPGWLRVVVLLLATLGTIGFAVLNGLAWRAHNTQAAAVEMTFPLRGGTWYIGTGGSNAVLNLHHKPGTPAQHFAIDIDGLDRLGRYAHGLLPQRLDDFVIFGATVHSPCAGVVLAARDSVPDHAPFEYDADSGGGNQVVLDCNGLRVALLHLQQGSVLVRPGDQVTAAQPLGRVGNSGFSVHPHLHLQASRGARADTTADHAGVPMRFGGRFLVRNDRVVN